MSRAKQGSFFALASPSSRHWDRRPGRAYTDHLGSARKALYEMLFCDYGVDPLGQGVTVAS